jgi:hypothetical protein
VKYVVLYIGEPNNKPIVKTKVLVLKISGDHPSHAFTELEGHDELAEHLISPSTATNQIQLFLAENICPDTICLLGNHFKVDPQFFADHLDNYSWHKFGDNIQDRVRVLPSSRIKEDHAHLYFIASRNLLDVDNTMVLSKLDSSGTIITDTRRARVERRAGFMFPESPDGGELSDDSELKPYFFTPVPITAWV